MSNPVILTLNAVNAFTRVKACATCSLVPPLQAAGQLARFVVKRKNLSDATFRSFGRCRSLRMTLFFFARSLILPGITLLLNMDNAFAQACPLCKLSLLHSPEGRVMVRAFNDGILFLLAMPYLVGGVTALSIFYLHRKRMKRDHE